MTKLEIAVRLTEAYLRNDSEKRRYGDSQADSIILNSLERKQFAEAICDLAQQLVKNCEDNPPRKTTEDYTPSYGR